ncbi:GNAT family N-acetyltransferase [Micromonospora sp. CPCC 205371]|nr:GNAT family N-acetyltransferase [Micromonospora sp. CPCC 205371]
MTLPPGVALHRHTGADIDQLLDEIAELYEVTYAEPPYNGGSVFRRERMLERTDSQKEAPGFSLVAARDGTDLIGFSFGFTFGEGRWWGGKTTPEPPSEVLAPPKFAVIELVVAKAWRGRRLGTALMDAVLAGRAEPYATLLSEPDAPARRIYEHWGWKHVADVQPAEDAPYMHALVLPLTLNDRSRRNHPTT